MFIKIIITSLAFISISVLAREEVKNTNIIADPPSFNETLRRSAHGNFLSGRTASILHDTGAASVFWRAAFRQEPNNPFLLERAFISTLSDGSIDQAAPLAERILAIDKNHRLSRLTLAAKASKSAQFKVAKTHLLAIAKGQSDLTSALLTAWAHVGLNEQEEAFKAIDKISNTDIYALFRNYHSGLIYDLTGVQAKAGEKYEAAYKQNDGVLRISDAYGRWLSRNKGKAEALKIYTDYETHSPNHPFIKESKRALEEGSTLQPLVVNPTQGMAEAYYGIGSALAQSQGEEVALVYLQLARYLDPAHDMATSSLANLYEQNKNYNKSIALYRAIGTTSPLYLTANVQVGYDLDAIDKTDEAKKHLEGLVAQNPKNSEALQALGNILRNKKQFKESAEIYDRVIAQITTPAPEHWNIYFNRGMALERAKDWKRAEGDLKQALKLVPEGMKASRAHVMNYLGYSWVDLGLNVNEGLDLIRQAIAILPNDGHIIDSLGWGYYRLGRYEEAVIELEKALDIKQPFGSKANGFSDDPTLNDHLGDAYWMVGRKIEASFQWNKAKDLKPEPEDLEKILAKLKNGLSPIKAEAPK